MFLYLPSQYTLFKVACNALQAGSYSPETPSNRPILQDLDSILEIYSGSPDHWKLMGLLSRLNFLCYFIPLWIFVIMPLRVLNRYFPDLNEREQVGLGGHFLFLLAALGSASSLMMVLQGFYPWPFSLPIILFWLDVIFKLSTAHLENPFNTYRILEICIASSILTIIGLHVFPQQLYSTCSSESLLVIFGIAMMLMFFVALTISFFFESKRLGAELQHLQA